MKEVGEEEGEEGEEEEEEKEEDRTGKARNAIAVGIKTKQD